MMKICENCQFWREKSWCSNTKSVKSRQAVRGTSSCKAFVKLGKKAPVVLRVVNKVLGEVNEKLNDE